MRSPRTVTRFFESLLKQPGPVVRYLLPFVALAVAVALQAAIALFVPKQRGLSVCLLLPDRDLRYRLVWRLRARRDRQPDHDDRSSARWRFPASG